VRKRHSTKRVCATALQPNGQARPAYMPSMQQDIPSARRAVAAIPMISVCLGPVPSSASIGLVAIPIRSNAIQKSASHRATSRSAVHARRHVTILVVAPSRSLARRSARAGAQPRPAPGSLRGIVPCQFRLPGAPPLSPAFGDRVGVSRMGDDISAR
jgi:hypothetical protein